MSFRVEPGALEAFGRSLDVLAGDAGKAKSYVQVNQKAVEGGHGQLLGHLYALGVLRIGGAVQKNVTRLAELSTSSGKELHKCANVYRETERRIAEKIDQTYPKK